MLYPLNRHFFYSWSIGLKDSRQRNGLCVNYTLGINQLFNVKMNHFETDLVVSSREVHYKVLRMAIQFEIFFFLIKRQNGKCNVRTFRWFLFGVSPDVYWYSKSAFSQVTLNFELA